MEHLVINLKENLIQRRKNERRKVDELDKETYKELLFISSGKIFELDFLIKCLDDMIKYFEQTKKINK